MSAALCPRKLAGSAPKPMEKTSRQEAARDRVTDWRSQGREILLTPQQPPTSSIPTKPLPLHLGKFSL